MNEQLEIIPFGKYKGQPVEVLQSDKQYIDWIMTQDWFVQKYPTIRTLIVNNFNQPSDSPEHNLLVNNFIDDDFCVKFFVALGYNIVNKFKYPEISVYEGNEYKVQWIDEPKIKITKRFEVKDGSDVEIFIEISRKYKITVPDYSVPLRQLPSMISIKDCTKDVMNYAEAPKTEIQTKELTNSFTKYVFALIECKPVVGDDYPSIIRQCRAQKSNALFIGEYISKVTSIDNLRKMFNDIKIVLLSDIL